MDQFTVELATSILHLEMQKETILKEDEIKNTLCICRRRILYNYINVCQLFFIRFTGKIIKFMEDKDTLKSMTIDDLHQWYISEMYDKLFHKKCMSDKMVLLYKLLQKDSDDAFFKYFYEVFEKLLETYKAESNYTFKGELNEIYSAILEWMESHILGIISIQLECDHISDKLLDDHAYIISPTRNDCMSGSCDLCMYHNPICPKAEMEKRQERVEEKIHLYLTDDQLEDTSWIENYIRLIVKYHTKPKNIDLILDFILFEGLNKIDFTERMLKQLNKAEKCFRGVTLVNIDAVNFGQLEESVLKFIMKEDSADTKE